MAPPAAAPPAAAAASAVEGALAIDYAGGAGGGEFERRAEFAVALAPQPGLRVLSLRILPSRRRPATAEAGPDAVTTGHSSAAAAAAAAAAEYSSLAPAHAAAGRWAEEAVEAVAEEAGEAGEATVVVEVANEGVGRFRLHGLVDSEIATGG